MKDAGKRTAAPLLRIEDLRVAFPGPKGPIRAVEGIDISLGKGECLALVGESGCGKSVTSLAAMKLLGPTGAMMSKRLEVCGREISAYGQREMQQLRGSSISMIFQDALSALNPVMTVGKQLDEIYRKHMGLDKREAKKRSIEALSLVGVPDPAARYRAYPHELSGGMRQRVLIAMAFACDPEIIIADEPTTALDVTIQAQVLELLGKMQKEKGTALLLISHDLSVVVHMADRVAVMYSGKIVEEADTRTLFREPLHPYTQGLMASVARIDEGGEEFSQIPGSLPDPAEKPAGCYFNPRCPYAKDICREKMPPLEEISEGRRVRCHLRGGEGLE